LSLLRLRVLALSPPSHSLADSPACVVMFNNL
jgi:hypothetical protein